MNISLLHATYRRPGGPLGLRDAWLELAAQPDSVEYVVALDEDDQLAVEATTKCRRAIGSAQSGWATSVRNWNAAARLATGDLLVVVADDLYPAPAWDAKLWNIVGRLDPSVVAYAIKVQDSPASARLLLRHPVISRAFYNEHGLFSESYYGVYCDDDILMRAFWRSFILDGRSLVLEHRHPKYGSTFVSSESHARVNAEHEYRHGVAVYTASWPRWQRTAQPRLVPSAEVRSLTVSNLQRIALRMRAREFLVYPFREICSVTRRTIRSLPTLHARALSVLRRFRSPAK